MFELMRPIDRVYAIKQITSAMKREMSFDDIDIFFSALRIEGPYTHPDESVSIETYIRSFLKKCNEDVLFDIAKQLGLDVPIDDNTAKAFTESKYWLLDHFRLFISHHHLAKEPAANLRKALQPYGVSAFVSHDDIEPTDEWREELLNALMSMDALIAILTPEFGGSKWTDQEVGIGIAQEKLIIPVNKGVHPYGFIEKYQSFNTANLTIREVANKVFKIICANARTKNRIGDCLVKLILTSANVAEATFKLDRLKEIEGVLDATWEGIRENVARNSTLSSSVNFVDGLNAVLGAKKLKTLELVAAKSIKTLDDEIPF